jgi:hypothetical protein
MLRTVSNRCRSHRKRPGGPGVGELVGDVMHATLAGLVLLMLVLALVVFMAAFVAQGRRLLAGTAAVLALFVLGVSYFVIAPALLDTEKGQLQQQVAELRRDEARARTDLVALRRDHGRLEITHDDALKAAEAARKRHQSQLEGIHTELLETRSLLTTEARGAFLPVRTGTTGAAGQRYEQIVDTARELRNLQPRSVAAPPSPALVQRQDQTRDLMQLKDRMGARLSTPSYDVEVYPDRELIGGRPGRYYVVDLKEAVSGVRYYFEGGRYTISRSSAEFRTSLNTFIADVLGKMEGNVRYDLFVRGSADRKPYQGRFEPGFEYRQVRFLRSAGGDRYRNDTGERTLDSVVRNEDLPDLRATFIRNLVAESYPVKPPIVLEGSVTPKLDNRDRNVELILFVDW